MIFIHLSQSWHGKPLHDSTNTWYQDAAFRFVVHRTNKRKNFWFAQESWAAAELTSPRQARAALGAAAGLGLRAQHHHWPTRNRDTKGRLIRLRPTKETPSLVQRRTWEAPVHAHVPGAFSLV